MDYYRISFTFMLNIKWASYVFYHLGFVTTEVDCNSRNASDLNLLKFWGGKNVALILCCP